MKKKRNVTYIGHPNELNVGRALPLDRCVGALVRVVVATESEQPLLHPSLLLDVLKPKSNVLLKLLIVNISGFLLPEELNGDPGGEFPSLFGRKPADGVARLERECGERRG